MFCVMDGYPLSFFSIFKIESRGGKCIPVQCDHSKDSDIEELFNRVSKEQNGQLDVLVNNAYAAVKVRSYTVLASSFICCSPDIF